MMLILHKEEDPVISGYIHLFGNELQYIVLNSENIEEVVGKGKCEFRIERLSKQIFILKLKS